MKKLYLILSILFMAAVSKAQINDALPITALYTGDTTKPLVFYISGDGGMNKFSKSFMQALQTSGYAVVALDARSYFWKKKTPQQAAGDINRTIAQYQKQWKRKTCIFIGYSFGADVAPFIVNRLSADVQNKTKNLVLISPSPTTDFEIHIANLFGIDNSGESVPAQINKLTKKVVLFFGSDEDDFPLNKLTIKNKEVVVLPGGHHYDGDPAGLAKQIMTRIK